MLLTVALTGQTEGDRIRPPSGNISESVALTGQTEGYRIPPTARASGRSVALTGQTEGHRISFALLVHFMALRSPDKPRDTTSGII